MRLFIQMRNDGPFEHPVTEQNLRYIFPTFDPENPPHGFVEFIRSPQPEIGIWQVLSGSYYEKRPDGKYTDVYYVRDMSRSEREEKLRLTRERFPFKSWTMNENTLEFTPPVAKPEDGLFYDWSEEQQQWLPIDDMAINVPDPNA